MQYIKVRWIHDLADGPVWLYSEVDDQWCEQRKVEVFIDGRTGFASSSETSLETRLSLEPLPTLADIASDPQFEPQVITAEEFHRVWAARRENVLSLLEPGS